MAEDFLNWSGKHKTSAKQGKDGKVITDTNEKDSDLKENPFNTKHGQEIVSISESFWARLSREGRHRNAFTLAGTMPSDNTYAYGANVKVSAGTIFYPRVITVSSSVDAELTISVGTGINQADAANSGGVSYVAWCRAGEPFTITFDGEIFAMENKTVEIRGRTTNASGKLYGSIYGIEVVANA